MAKLENQNQDSDYDYTNIFGHLHASSRSDKYEFMVLFVQPIYIDLCIRAYQSGLDRSVFGGTLHGGPYLWRHYATIEHEGFSEVYFRKKISK